MFSVPIAVKLLHLMLKPEGTLQFEIYTTEQTKDGEFGVLIFEMKDPRCSFMTKNDRWDYEKADWKDVYHGDGWVRAYPTVFDDCRYELRDRNGNVVVRPPDDRFVTAQIRPRSPMCVWRNSDYLRVDQKARKQGGDKQAAKRQRVDKPVERLFQEGAVLGARPQELRIQNVSDGMIRRGPLSPQQKQQIKLLLEQPYDVRVHQGCISGLGTEDWGPTKAYGMPWAKVQEFVKKRYGSVTFDERDEVSPIPLDPALRPGMLRGYRDGDVEERHPPIQYGSPFDIHDQTTYTLECMLASPAFLGLSKKALRMLVESNGNFLILNPQETLPFTDNKFGRFFQGPDDTGPMDPWYDTDGPNGSVENQNIARARSLAFWERAMKYGPEWIELASIWFQSEEARKEFGDPWVRLRFTVATGLRIESLIGHIAYAGMMAKARANPEDIYEFPTIEYHSPFPHVLLRVGRWDLWHYDTESRKENYDPNQFSYQLLYEVFSNNPIVNRGLTGKAFMFLRYGCAIDVPATAKLVEELGLTTVSHRSHIVWADLTQDQRPTIEQFKPNFFTAWAFNEPPMQGVNRGNFIKVSDWVRSSINKQKVEDVTTASFLPSEVYHYWPIPPEALSGMHDWIQALEPMLKLVTNSDAMLALYGKQAQTGLHEMAPGSLMHSSQFEKEDRMNCMGAACSFIHMAKSDPTLVDEEAQRNAILKSLCIATGHPFIRNARKWGTNTPSPNGDDEADDADDSDSDSSSDSDGNGDQDEDMEKGNKGPEEEDEDPGFSDGVDGVKVGTFDELEKEEELRAQREQQDAQEEQEEDQESEQSDDNRFPPDSMWGEPYYECELVPDAPLNITLDIGGVILRKVIGPAKCYLKKWDKDKNPFWTTNRDAAESILVPGVIPVLARLIKKYGAKRFHILSKAGRYMEPQIRKCLRLVQFYKRTGFLESNLTFCQQRSGPFGKGPKAKGLRPFIHLDDHQECLWSIWCDYYGNNHKDIWLCYGGLYLMPEYLTSTTNNDQMQGRHPKPAYFDEWDQCGCSLEKRTQDWEYPPRAGDPRNQAYGYDEWINQEELNMPQQPKSIPVATWIQFEQQVMACMGRHERKKDQYGNIWKPPDDDGKTDSSNSDDEGGGPDDGGQGSKHRGEKSSPTEPNRKRTSPGADRNDGGANKQPNFGRGRNVTQNDWPVFHDPDVVQVSQEVSEVFSCGNDAPQYSISPERIREELKAMHNDPDYFRLPLGCKANAVVSIAMGLIPSLMEISSEVLEEEKSKEAAWLAQYPGVLQSAPDGAQGGKQQAEEASALQDALMEVAEIKLNGPDGSSVETTNDKPITGVGGDGMESPEVASLPRTNIPPPGCCARTYPAMGECAGPLVPCMYCIMVKQKEIPCFVCLRHNPGGAIPQSGLCPCCRALLDDKHIPVGMWKKENSYWPAWELSESLSVVACLDRIEAKLRKDHKSPEEVKEVTSYVTQRLFELVPELSWGDECSDKIKVQTILLSFRMHQLLEAMKGKEAMVQMVDEVVGNDPESFTLLVSRLDQAENETDEIHIARHQYYALLKRKESGQQVNEEKFKALEARVSPFYGYQSKEVDAGSKELTMAEDSVKGKTEGAAFLEPNSIGPSVLPPDSRPETAVGAQPQKPAASGDQKLKADKDRASLGPAPPRKNQGSEGKALSLTVGGAGVRLATEKGKRGAPAAAAKATMSVKDNNGCILSHGRLSARWPPFMRPTKKQLYNYRTTESGAERWQDDHKYYGCKIEQLGHECESTYRKDPFDTQENWACSYCNTVNACDRMYCTKCRRCWMFPVGNRWHHGGKATPMGHDWEYKSTGFVYAFPRGSRSAGKSGVRCNDTL